MSEPFEDPFVVLQEELTGQLFVKDEVDSLSLQYVADGTWTVVQETAMVFAALQASQILEAESGLSNHYFSLEK